MNICRQILISLLAILFINNFVSAQITRVKNSSTTAKSQIQADYQRTLRELFDDQASIDPNTTNPKFSIFTEQAWRLLSNWSCDYLALHANADAAQLTAAIKAFDRSAQKDYPINVKIVPLGRGKHAAFAISAYWTWLGTFFVITRTPQGNWQQVWSIKDLAAQNISTDNEFSCWSDDLTPDDESIDDPSLAVNNNPRLTGDIYQLPATDNQQARFYVDAIANPTAGISYMAQISIWQWDGNNVNCSFISNYQMNIDVEAAGVKYSSGKLTIRTKEQPKSFYTADSSPDPAADWILAITPTGVEDLGHHYLQPELQTIDQLLQAIITAQDASDLASDSVITELSQAIANNQDDNKVTTSLGMLMNFEITRIDDVSTVNISIDGLGDYRLTIINQSDHYFVSEVKILLAD